MKYLIISLVITYIVIWIPIILVITKSALYVYTTQNITRVDPVVQIHNQLHFPYKSNNNTYIRDNNTYVSDNLNDIEKMLSISYGVYQLLPLIIMD